MSCVNPIEPFHNPNEGRDIINDNFKTICTMAFSGVSGHTVIISGANISAPQTGSNPPEYTISLSGDVSTDSVFATNLTGGTIFSGDTELSLLFQPIGSDTEHTFVQPGSNVTTGGTNSLPIISVVDSPFFNDLSISGTGTANSFSATTLSGDTIYSGSTDLYDIFLSSADGNDITRVQDGLNTYTGGTDNLPTVNVSALTIDNINVSGDATFNSLSATSLSGGTIYSGSTDLYDIFSTTDESDVTRIQDGLNTYTGGTDNLPTVNVSALTIDNINVSGNSVFTSLSATSLSGGTIYSGSTDLSLLLSSNNVGDDVKNFINSGETVTIAENFQYLVYGDLTINTGGTLTNDGEVVIINGGIILSGGTFNNNSTLLQVDLQLDGTGNFTFVQPGANILTGGTPNLPVVSVVDNITTNSITLTATTEAALNLPVFITDPGILTDGDAWIISGATSAFISVRVGGVTRTVELS